MPRDVVRVRRAALLAVALAAVAGCTDSTGLPPGCTGAVTVAVGAGTAPDISWAPACLINEVWVHTTNNITMWRIGGAGTPEIIAPSVRYGVTPSGVPPQTATPLQPGKTYTVELYSIDTINGGQSLQGTLDFAP